MHLKQSLAFGIHRVLLSTCVITEQADGRFSEERR